MQLEKYTCGLCGTTHDGKPIFKHTVAPFVCIARYSNTDPPQDCNWPQCGCDPIANKVIDHIAESDFVILSRAALDRVFQIALTHLMQVPERNQTVCAKNEHAFKECRLVLGDGDQITCD